MSATVTDIKNRLDVDSGAELATNSLALNEVASMNLSISRPVALKPYAINHRLRAFILVNKQTNTPWVQGRLSVRFAVRRISSGSISTLDSEQELHMST